jgi:beta-glucosidase-like glycosyl hydrolase
MIEIGANRILSTSYKFPTSFPCPSALGAAFNETLYDMIGSIVGREGRAFSNVRSHTMNGSGDGFDYWSPVVNMQRDPRWGRNQEVPSEDPFLTSRYAVNYIQGLQQYHPDNDVSDNNN